MNEFGIVKPAPPAIEIEHVPHGSDCLTAVVLGLPFSGTSMAAVVVDALGVPIIRDASFPFAYEADEFNNVNMDRLRESIARHNAELPVWGFKDPHAKRHDAKEFHASIRNPHYVIVTKDLASVAIRAMQNPMLPNDGRLPIERLTGIAIQQAEFSTWILRLPSAPKLLVSYHASLRDTETTCRIIAEFLHLQPTTEQIQRAAARVSPSGGYLTKEESNA